MSEPRKLPTLFESRPMGVRILLVVVVPAVFGAIAGFLLAPLPGLYIALQVVAAVGGILAGLEHRGFGQAAMRGLGAGLVFGVAILVAHAISGGTDHNYLGKAPIALPAITAVAGAILALIGAFARRRLETAS